MSTPIVTLIANLRGRTGPKGPQGLPGTNAEENDAAFAAAVASSSSLTRGELDELLDLLGAVSVERFGATGSGDDTDAIQAALDSGEPVISFPREYAIEQVTVSTNAQSLIGYGPFGPSMLTRSYREASPMIIVEEQGVRFQGLGLKNTATVDDAYQDYAIFAESPETGEGGTQRSSIDLCIDDCYISGWRTGVKLVGQGLRATNSLWSLNRFCVELDFPSNWEDVDDANQYGEQTAFRYFHFGDNRMHAIREAFVLNNGAYADNIRTLKIDGLVGDIGGEIFQGVLGPGSEIRRFQIDMTNRPWGIRLQDGSSGFTIGQGTFRGRRATVEVEERSPTRFLYGTGTISDFTVEDVTIENTRQHGLQFDGPVHNGLFENIRARGVGYDGSSYSVFYFGDADTQATIDGFRLDQIDETTGTPVRVVTGSSSTDVKVIDAEHIGDYRTGGFISPVTGAIANGRRGSAPAAGYWKAGAVVMHSVPVSASPMGWICTADGNPGTWTALPNVP